MSLPRLFLVEQHFPDRSLSDISASVSAELTSKNLGASLPVGSSVAIGVGSRGISNIAQIVRAVVDYWQSRGMKPFLFPAMGSHGAATAEGQASVLAHYGITEETMGCPVISQLDVVSLGRTAEGLEAFMDRKAFESAGVMLIGRVKWHTDFSGGIESGLFKMMAIGLGKFAGAQRYHTAAYKLGLEFVIRSVGRQVLKSGKILGGLAILEGARHETAQLTVVRPDNMESEEEVLLQRVKSWMGHVPVKALDILVLDEIGKNISGAGMDTKVANRSVSGLYNPWPNTPSFERIFVRDLSENTYGNGVGVGMADVINSRILEKIDWHPTWINSLTASTPSAVRCPLHYASDLQCIHTIARTVGKGDLSEVTIGRIRNTLELGLMELSANLENEIRAQEHLKIVEGPYEIPYDFFGNLTKLPAGSKH
jgi:hypothetical protein